MTGQKAAMMGGALLALCGLAMSAGAAPHGVKVGILTCHVHSGWGYVVGSSKGMDCDYHPEHHDVDRYTGSISKFGVDIGYTSGGTIIWDVVAPSSDIRPGALQGDYAGATASATIGAGIGANVLVGGLDKSIALQPVSVMGNTGLDISAGVGAMSLRAVEPPAPPIADVPPPPVAVAEVPPARIVKESIHHSPHRRHVSHHVRNKETCPK
jgi:Protein of unknown function (DUF992)